jgi:hypothetical protein
MEASQAESQVPLQQGWGRGFKDTNCSDGKQIPKVEEKRDG